MEENSENMDEETAEPEEKPGIWTGVAALTFGVNAFFYKGILGGRAEYPVMFALAVAAVILAVVGIYRARNMFTYAGLAGAVLAIVSYFL